MLHHRAGSFAIIRRITRDYRRLAVPPALGGVRRIACSGPERYSGSAMTTSPTTDWLAQARALAPLVAQYREQGEQERRLPQPVLDAVRAAGLLRMLVPRTLGGAQGP